MNRKDRDFIDYKGPKDYSEPEDFDADENLTEEQSADNTEDPEEMEEDLPEEMLQAQENDEDFEVDEDALARNAGIYSDDLEEAGSSQSGSERGTDYFQSDHADYARSDVHPRFKGAGAEEYSRTVDDQEDVRAALKRSEKARREAEERAERERREKEKAIRERDRIRREAEEEVREREKENRRRYRRDRYEDDYDEDYEDRRSGRRDDFDDDYDEDWSDRKDRGNIKNRKEKRSGKKDRDRKKKKKKHIFLKLILILLLIAAVFVGYLYLKIRKMQVNGTNIDVSTNEGVETTEGYTNLALFGVDSIEGSLDSGNNRTDVIIIASINDLTGEIKLASIYRDTWLNIGNDTYSKANAAYAYGGPEQAVQMLNTNWDMDIADYVTIGFEGVAALIDDVGGIELDIEQDEIEHLNNYQMTMAQELGVDYTPIESAGTQTVNGLQATAYCRIRYTDGNDFKRTERQRTVLTKAIEKLKAASVTQQLSVMNDMMDKIRTSLTTSELTELAARAKTYNIVDTSGFPTEELRTTGYIGDQSCVIPVHLTDNVTALHAYLFGTEGYVPSQTVQDISAKISADYGY